MQLFSPDSDSLLRKFGVYVADAFVLSFVWFLCSIPVITIVPASIALYDATVNGAHVGKPYVKRFFKAFKQSLKRGCFISLFAVLIGFIFYAVFQIIYAYAGSVHARNTTVLVFFLLMLPIIGFFCWLCAQEARFKATIKQLYKNSAIITIAHLPQTIAISALLVAIIEIGVLFVFVIPILPYTVSYFQSLFIEKVFARYMSMDSKKCS